MTLTGEILRKVSPNLPLDRANKLAAISNALCPVYGIDNADVYHEFIANIVHESGGFRIRKESLNYTRPERLVQVWPSRFTLPVVTFDKNGKRIETIDKSKKDARLWVNKPIELANFVYGGRMGNIHPGDGAMFVGGGFPQITGRDAYTMYTRYVNNKTGNKFTIQEIANLIQTTDEWAFDCAFWFFCEFKNLEQLALQDNFKELVKKWNGGFIGFKERSEIYALAKKYIV